MRRSQSPVRTKKFQESFFLRSPDKRGNTSIQSCEQTRASTQLQRSKQTRMKIVEKNIEKLNDRQKLRDMIVMIKTQNDKRTQRLDFLRSMIKPELMDQTINNNMTRNKYFYQISAAKSAENLTFPKMRTEMNQHLMNYNLKEELFKIQSRNAQRLVLDQSRDEVIHLHGCYYRGEQDQMNKDIQENLQLTSNDIEPPQSFAFPKSPYREPLIRSFNKD